MNTRLCVLLVAVFCASAYGSFLPKMYAPLMNAVYSYDQLDFTFSSFDSVYTLYADVTKAKKDYPKSGFVSTISNPSVTVALYTSNTAIFDQKCYSTASAPAGTAFTATTDPAVTWEYLNFTATGAPATGNLALDYQSFYLTQDKSVAIKTTGCTSPKDPSKTSLYGVVGMGGNGKSADNYINNKEFAVYASDIGNLKMLVSPDFKGKVGDAKATFTTDASFVATGSVILNTGAAGSLTAAGTFDNYKLIFDVNTQGFGLPTNVYTKLIETLAKSTLACSKDTSGFTTCTGAAPTEWPVIEIKLGDANITLSGKDYVQKSIGTSHTLLFQQLDSALAQPNYINAAWANTVVVGAPFLKTHFVHFDATNKKVTIYKPTTSFNPLGLVVVAGFLAFTGFMFCFVFICLPLLGCCCLCGIAYCIYKAVSKKNSPVVVDYHVAAGGYQAPQGHY